MSVRRKLEHPDAACPYDRCDGSGRHWVDGQGDFVPFDEDGDPHYVENGVIVCDPDLLERPACQCLEQRNALRRLIKTRRRMPFQLQHAGFERWPINLMPKETVAPIRAWARKAPKHIEKGAGGLWLTGARGTGKSTLAAAAILEAAEHGLTCQYWNFSELLQHIRNTSFGDAPSLSDLRWTDDLAAVDILVLDDLGAEKVTDFSISTIYNILNRREQDNCRPVILTTNESVEDLREKVSDRVVSRLFATAGAPIEIGGQDHRELEAVRERDRRLSEAA